MRDVDNGRAATSEITHHGEQALLVLFRERGGRLVHNEDAGTGAERARNLDELLLGHGEVADLGFGRDVGADAAEELRGAGAPIRPSDAPPGGGGFEAEGDVLGNGEVWEQGWLLINAGDAQFVGRRGSETADGLAGDFNRAGVRPMRARDDLDESGFAGAILAY
jgi:hypothetical protein